jgi:hypothetical protein
MQIKVQSTKQSNAFLTRHLAPTNHTIMLIKN